MRDNILKILSEIRPEFDFGESKNFVEDGYLDSFDVVTVISEIEKEFGVIIDGLELVPENFESIDTIAALIERSEKRI